VEDRASAGALQSCRGMFGEMDRHGKGTLNFEEMREFLEKGNPDMTKVDLYSLFRSIDKDGNRAVTFEEFVEYLFSPPPPALPVLAASGKGAEPKPGSRANVSAIYEEFPFKGYIDDTEDRGITPMQLLKVATYVAAHGGEWIDNAPPHISRTSGEIISIQWANLYHIDSWLIRPGTRRADCAFVELLTCKRQRPKWFVSHWWGESIRQFVACIEKHRWLRQMSPDDDPYWVCAYANRQHSLAKEIVDDPRETSFCKALTLAKGVLLVLNDASPHQDAAMPFTRVWCSFEVSLALDLRGNSFWLDVAAAKEGPAIRADGSIELGETEVLTQGLVDVDHGDMRAKFSREANFSLQVMREGLSVEIQKAEASVEKDRKAILNCLCGKDAANLGEEPLREHDNYDVTNQRLRRIFAVAMLTKAIASGKDDLVLDLLVTIGVDSSCKDLSFCFATWSTEDLDSVAACLSNLISLETLALDFQDCTRLWNVNALGGSFAQLKKLKVLKLEFYKCTDLKDVNELFKGVAHLKALTELKVDLNRTQVASVDALGDSLKELTEVQTLVLKFPRLRNLSSLERLGNGIAYQRKLSFLGLDVRFCKKLTNLDKFASWLAKLRRLGNVEMRFDNCPCLPKSIQEPTFTNLSDFLVAMCVVPHPGPAGKSGKWRNSTSSDDLERDELDAPAGSGDGV